MGENGSWRAHKGALNEEEMDAQCCVGGQRVHQSEIMPYATERQEKSSKRQRRSGVRQERLEPIRADIIHVWPSHFSSRSPLRGCATDRGETREGAERVRGRGSPR